MLNLTFFFSFCFFSFFSFFQLFSAFFSFFPRNFLKNRIFLGHSITSFYSLFFFWTSSHTISWLIQIWAKRNDMGQKTALGSLLKSIGNSGQGKVVPGWGAVPVMAFIGVLLLVFLVIMLQIYNQSLLLQGFSVDWNG